MISDTVIESTRQDLYADVLEWYLLDGDVVFLAFDYQHRRMYTFTVAQADLHQPKKNVINVVVDAFRAKFNQVGI